MLTHVKIENYRGFKSYRLEQVSRVNLLVGKNNTGKTALLESAHLLISGGDPMVLVNAASRRGEVVSGGREDSLFLDISHFFHGHEVAEGSSFSVAASNGLRPVTATIVPLEEIEPQQKLFDDVRGTRPAFALSVRCGADETISPRYFVLSEEGGWLDLRRPPRRPFGDEHRGGPSVVFIAHDYVEPDSLGAMWNQVLREKQESDVRQAMQILEPALEDIVFQSGDISYRPYSRAVAGRSGVLVSVKGQARRVPLGSMGDGMRRLLALSISLIHAKGGYLLIDEIDTGFHYSIMAKMWELVVRTARESNVQVFATTHSSDCVKGLGLLCKDDPELQSDVCVQKIVRDLESSIPFSGADVLNAIEHDIELR